MIIGNLPQRRRDWLWGAGRLLFLVGVVLGSSATLSCGSTTSPHHAAGNIDAGSGDSGAPTVPDASTAPLNVTVADLAAAGLSVFADPTQVTPLFPPTTAIERSPFGLLLDQANAMIAEADAHQGMLGSDIDSLIVLASDLPTASYFLAGYVSAAGTPGATLARKIMGTEDWRHAPTVVYPSLVFALFAADAARYGNALAGAQMTGTAGQPLSLPPGLCSAVQGFIDSTIVDFFDALGHLEAPKIPASGVGIIDWFGSGLQAALDLGASVINGVIDAGRFVVVQGVKAATQPLLDAIATVAGPIGVAASIVSVLRPWTVQMDAAPPQTSKGVEPGAGLPGTVTATVTLPGGLDEWPDVLVDCAKAAGVTLPPLKPIGAPVTWTLAQSPDALVIQNAGTATVLDDQASANVGYVTTTETAKAARGDALEGKLKTDITIRRKEIADLQKTISDALFAKIPSLIRPIVQSVLSPAVNAVLGLPPALLDTHGYASVVVNYHVCSSGDCCPTGQIACEPVCVDPSTDAANCGACGNVCPSGQPCAGGLCVPAPPPTPCTPSCPSGRICQNGNCVPAASVGSCTTADGKGCNDFTGVNWTLAMTKQQGCPSPSVWSANACPAVGRLGSCVRPVGTPPRDFSFVIRLYPGAPTTFCNTCKSESDCAESFNPMGPANPTHPCTNGCCDLRQNAQDAAIACDCTVPGDPGCPNWTPN